MEFNVSYNVAVKWLSEIGFISSIRKSELFNKKQEMTSSESSMICLYECTFGFSKNHVKNKF